MQAHAFRSGLMTSLEMGTKIPLCEAQLLISRKDFLFDPVVTTPEEVKLFLRHHYQFSVIITNFRIF